MKNKLIYIIGTFCGATTLIVGVSIFLICWAARHFFAIAIPDLEVYGFIWIMIAFPIAVIGLFLILFALGNNYPKYLTRTTASLILILINIPAVYLIMEKQSNIQKRAYIKLINKSNLNKLELTLSGSTFEQKLGILDMKESMVTNFYPKYLSDPRESVPTVDSVTLTIRTDQKEYQVLLPPVYKGACEHLIINGDLEIK